MSKNQVREIDIKASAKYSPKKWAVIAYIALICVGLFSILAKRYESINGNYILLPDEIYLHMTNFSLSLIFYLGIGYLGLLFDVKFRNIVILGLVIVIANFICETLMAFMNTIDIIDAVYGTFGVLIAFVFLFIVKKHGLVKNSAESN